MRQYWYRGSEPNFGDELNHFVWPRLLPDVFDDDPSCLFLGIGSILFDSHPKDARKVVMGAGYGGYTAAPDLKDGTWQVHFVRGPRTAAKFGLDPSLAIADSGILVRTLVDISARTPRATSFMPHLSSLRRGPWQAVCRMAGISFIDPRSSVDVVIRQLLDSEVVIAEAMHGAIVADALRVPWIPVLPLNPLNRLKWLDWADSLGIAYRPVSLRPSSLVEWKLTRLSGSRVASKLASLLDESAFGDSVNRQIREIAAGQLAKIAAGTRYLSDEVRLNSAIEAMREKLERFRQSL